MRLTSRSPGFGIRTKSQNHRSRNTPSHTNIPAIRRGDHAAGTTQINPSNSPTKDCVPNPIPSQCVDFARADITGGTKVGISVVLDVETAAGTELTSGPRRLREF